MTKRLFAYLGITMLFTFTAVFYFGLWGVIAACVCAAVFFAAAFLYRGRNRNKSACVLIAFVIMVSLIVFSVYDNSFKEKAEKYDWKTVDITAVALENGYENYGSYYYELKTEAVNGESESIKLLLKTNYDIGLEYRDKIEAKVALRSNDTGYYKSRNYVYTAYSEEFSLDCKITKEENKGIRYIPIMLRENLVRALRRLMPDVEGEMCAAMTFGVRSELNKEVYSLVSRSGLSFFVVVSGLHMSIIVMAIMALLKPLERNKLLNKVRYILTVIVILTYMGITGFTPSVVRSGVMIIISVVATAIFRQSEKYNNLGLAALILTACNPYAVGDAGLLLSFASVFGIFYLKPRITGRTVSAIDTKSAEARRLLKATNIRARIFEYKTRLIYNRIMRWLVNAFAISLSATAVIAPLTLLFFGTASPFVVVFGVVLTPFVTAMILCSMLAAVCCFIPVLSSAAFVAAFPAWLCCNVFLRITGAINNAEWWMLFIDRDIVLVISAVTAVAAIAAALFSKKPNVKVPAAVALSLLLICGVSVKTAHSSSLALRLLSAGNGTVIQLSGSGAEAVLGFAGRPRSGSGLFEKLRRRAGDVKTLAITDSSLANCRVGIGLINEFDVDAILLYHSDRTAQDLVDRALNIKNYIELESEDTVTLNFGNGITDTVISTGKYVWQYLRAGNYTVLIAPDGGHAEALDSQYRRADFLLVCGKLSESDALGYSRCLLLDGGESVENIKNAETVFGSDYYLELK